jgi:hypothetical protein
MRNYTWSYGIFHWFIHYTIAVMLVMLSGIRIFSNYIFDYLLVIVISSLVDLDHLPVLAKFGAKRAIFAEKRIVTPIHDFFFLSLFSIMSALAAIFISREIGILIFAVVLHMVWDIFEDVAVFRTSFRRWEKTWGLDKKELEEAYNELLQTEVHQPKKESKIRRMGIRLKDRIRRKKQMFLF